MFIFVKVSTGMGHETKKRTVGREQKILSKGVGKSSRGRDSEGDAGGGEVGGPTKTNRLLCVLIYF